MLVEHFPGGSGSAVSVIPVRFLAQIALGALRDAFVVRSLLMPALAYDLRRCIRWDSGPSGREAERTLEP
ncbi:MAG: hypothetical protein QM604_02185 [Microbacterium sp.]